VDGAQHNQSAKRTNSRREPLMATKNMISMLARRVGPVMLVLAGLGLIAACGSSSESTNPGTSSSPAGPVTVMARSGGMGMYLTDGQGTSLYLFVADTSGTSTCTGACAAAWPPLTTTGMPQAGSGVTASKLGTVTRADGTKQVTYDNHPLYSFTSDKAAGDVKGQGVNAFGALWWLVSPGGNAITTTAPTTGGY